MNEEQDVNEDLELIELWQKNDPRGFSGLYSKYKSRVFGFLLRMTSDRDIAEDLLQDTFFAAMRNSGQFDRNRNFLSWIFGIAHKRTIDYFRHLKVENEHIDDTDGSVGREFVSADTKLSNTQTMLLIQEAVKTLDPMQREVFLLRELGDVPFKEIAEIMNCPINTALGRMRLALKNIRNELKRNGFHGM